MISLRRELLNQELRGLDATLRGDVLEIGGKRDHFKGYRPPIEKCTSWKYLNPDPRTRPDYVARAEHIPLDSGSLDVVVMLEVLEYLAEPELAFAEIHRTLRVGGALVFSSPLLFPLHGDREFDRHRWSLVQIKETISRLGFELETARTIGSVGAVIHDILFVASSYASPGYPGSLTLKVLQKALSFSSPFFRMMDRMTTSQSDYLTTGYLVVCRKGASA